MRRFGGTAFTAPLLRTRRKPFYVRRMGVASVSPAHLHAAPHAVYVWASWRNQEETPTRKTLPLRVVDRCDGHPDRAQGALRHGLQQHGPLHDRRRGKSRTRATLHEWRYGRACFDGTGCSDTVLFMADGEARAKALGNLLVDLNLLGGVTISRR